MSASLRHHLAVSAKMLAGVGHEANDTHAGIRGPRAHDWEYILALGQETLPDNWEWLRKKLRWEDE